MKNQAQVWIALIASFWIGGTFAIAQETGDQSVVLRRQADNAYDANNYTEALRLFDASLVIKPSSRAYEGRGLAYYASGQIEKAIDDFEKALQKSPNRASLYFNRATCHIKLGNHSQAVDDLSHALVLDPAHAAMYLNQRGMEYMSLSDFQKAVEDFEAAIKVRPDYPTFQQNRDVAMRQLNEQKGAQAMSTMAKVVQQRQLLDKASQSAKVEADKNEIARVNRPVRDKWALLIGVSKFKDPALDLKYPSKDAHDFGDFLIKEANFKPDHVKVLTDEQATRANILGLLGEQWLPKLVQPDDLVLFYFSGHGSPAEMDAAGVNYLVTHDTVPANLIGTAIEMSEVAQRIKQRLKSDRIVLILDACHSGAVEGKGIKRTSNVDAQELALGTGQLVICSSERNERSWESKGYQNGVFTRWLMEGLRLKGSQTKLGDAFAFMKEKVHAEVLQDRGQSQTPVLKSKWVGNELLLAVPPSQTAR